MKRILLIIFCLALVALFSGTSGADQPVQKELRIGVTSGKVEKRLREYGLISQYLIARLKKYGIREGKVVVARDVPDMIEKIKQGAIDLTFESAFSTIEMEQAGMVPRLLAWRKGVREYRTVFFVKKNSPIKSLSDLRGRTIVYEDKSSTSAFVIPSAELKKSGVLPIPGDAANPSPAGVRYFFAGEANNQAYWVIQGKSDAAAFSNNDWEELPSKVRAELRIIHETKPVIRFVVSFHQQLAPVLREAIEKVLISMDEDPEGKKALEGASDTRKVEPLTQDDLLSMEYVRSLITALQ